MYKSIDEQMKEIKDRLKIPKDMQYKTRIRTYFVYIDDQGNPKKEMFFKTPKEVLSYGSCNLTIKEIEKKEVIILFGMRPDGIMQDLSEYFEEE